MGAHAHAHPSLTRVALAATVHCLTGCAIGEVLGLAVASAAGLGNAASIALAVALAFVFGYALSVRPVLRGGVEPRRALRIVLAADTASIATMEVVDNAIVLAVPGAMAAALLDGVFWWSLALGLFVAFWAAFPLNRFLIGRGRGHAVVHDLHAHRAS